MQLLHIIYTSKKNILSCNFFLSESNITNFFKKFSELEMQNNCKLLIMLDKIIKFQNYQSLKLKYLSKNLRKFFKEQY